MHWVDQTPVPEIAFHVYTDGSCIMKRRRVACASWGFVVFDEGNEPSNAETLLLQACGPVVVDKAAKMFTGAERRTN
eukprot:6342252-Karenia_brevis.AAC.1